MSLAEDLLNSLPDNQPAVTSADPATEPHIVINADKTITVPEELKRILVQHEHNIETVTFDCPRYWDGHDLSQMGLRIVFQRSDGHKEPHPVENLRIDESDDRMIHFDWTISGNTTFASGNVKITVCAKLTNAEGVSEREWHTIPNQDLFVNEGMDCSGEEIVERNPDVIEYILAELGELKNAAPTNPPTPSPDSGQNATNSVFAGRVASFYGDSTTEKNGHYGMGYHAWLKELLGLASYNNYGVSGYKIADVIAKVQAVSDTAQVIFCKIGVNDLGGDTPLGSLTDTESGTIYGGLNELCALLRSKYPTRLVVFITPAEQSRYPSEIGVTMFDVRTAIMEVCARHAIPVYDHYVLSGICTDNLDIYTTDGCHLNNTAHEMLGKNLALYMRNTFGYLYGTVAVTGVTLSASSGTLRVGESVTLTASVLPSNATNKQVVWTSGNGAVASVAGGVVTAIAPGTARITATTEEGGYAAYYDLTVEQASADTTYYTITNELTNVTTSNSTAQAAQGTAYAATLTVPEGYSMGAVTVTMGGVDITADVYSGGTITIPAVTGDVVVTATAAVAGAVNFVKSITSDGNQYLDTGIVPTTDIVAEVDFQSVQWSAWASIFGCEKGLLLSYQELDSGVLFAQIFGGNVYSTDSGMSYLALTDRHTAVIDCANKTWTIDGQVAHSALYIGTENNGNNMLVFARYAAAGNISGKSKTTLYDLKFSRGGETILNLRPCLDPSGVACMFDTVAQRYHYNLGTGEFTWEPLDE